ncbi:hypothetical protein Tco_0738877 [Tanacetum coccineum]
MLKFKSGRYAALWLGVMASSREILCANDTVAGTIGSHAVGFAAVLAVLVTGASQRRQHVITSSIHIESRKSPTKSLFDVGSSRISIVNVNTEKYHSDVLARSQG